ncbi:MAG: histidine phosphatase family protein [Clostridia bacterium]|nr:histidine phosphatase family protein [Clostridia bacterium]
MRVLLIRHGQTDWNKQGLLQGTKDIPLNATGLEQALAARESLLGEKIDMCYCSPLIRTRQTAEVVLKGRDIPVTYDERIVERRFGVAEGMSVYNIDFDATWVPDMPPMFEGMETFEMLLERLTGFFDDVYSKHKNDTVLVVTHGGVSIVSGYYFCGPPKTDRSEYFCKNCVVKEYIKE